MGGKRTRAQFNRSRKAHQQTRVGPVFDVPFASASRQITFVGTGQTSIVFKPTANLRSTLVAEVEEGSYVDGLTGYKYLAQKYVDDFLRGSTRIGTLHDYRREELGHGIADPNEGRKRLHLQRPLTRVVGGTPAGDAMRHMGFDVARDTIVDLKGINHVREVDHPDVFVWCCASVLDQEIMDGLAGAEACVKITDLGSFMRRMTAAINAVRPVKFLGMREIEYVPVDQPWNGVDLGLSAAFSKEPSAYGAQREIRAIWAPLDDEPIKPFILECEELGNFCHHVEVAD